MTPCSRTSGGETASYAITTCTWVRRQPSKTLSHRHCRRSSSAPAITKCPNPNTPPDVTASVRSWYELPPQPQRPKREIFNVIFKHNTSITLNGLQAVFFVQCQYFLDVGVWFLLPSPSNVPRQYYFDEFFALFCYALFYNHSQLCFCQSAISYTNDVTTMQYSLASLSTICKLLAPYESPVDITILHVHAIVV